MSNRKPCTWEGVDYPSITAAAKALGITHSAMSERLMRRDRPKRPRRKPVHMPCEYNGRFYSTLAEAARSSVYRATRHAQSSNFMTDITFWDKRTKKC